MSEAWSEWEGQVVDGSFRLQRLLGSGERSAVFLTQYGGAEPQDAVIKLVRAEPGDVELELSRWQRAAQLSHPHLIRIFQAGVWRAVDAEFLYAVMEYGEENLADVFRERPLAEVEAREMLEPVLAAVGYIHGKGLVHGHLKPANIIAVGDRVKIASDGIAMAGEPGAGRRPPGPYDAPEFATEGPSPAADVWSLGMILTEALTQRLPNRESSGQEPVLPEAMPPVFRDLARLCLRVDPGKRETVSAIAARLQRPRSVSPLPDAPGIVAPLPARRRWRYAMPLAAASALVLVGIVARPGLLQRQAHSTAAEPETSQPARSAGSEKSGSGGTVPVAPRQSATAPQAETVPRAATAPTAATPPVPGSVVEKVLPVIPQKARDTITGMVKISVRADVDPSGNVVSAKLYSPAPSKYFTGLTLSAARRWKFQPPKVLGEDVKSEWLLRFELTKGGTNVRTVQVFPIIDKVR
ncbi:MAG TPA: TonB family protein [Bryobacteraceae bacterium]